MADPSPFTPGATATLVLAATSASIALPTGGGSRFLLQNASAQQMFFATGGSSVTATTAGTPLVAGGVKTFTLDPGATYIAGIMGGGGTAGTLYITRGEGS